MKLKWIINSTVVIFLSGFLINFALADTYKIDSSHTAVVWKINHMGFSYQTGKWMADGTLILDAAKPQDSKVDVTIQINKLITGNDELNKHLLGSEFFDAAKYPTATFVSTKVEVTGKNTAKIYGDLTLHGVTKPVVLDTVLNKAGVNPITDKQAVGFTAHTKIKRSNFGINTLSSALSDEVDLEINVEAFKAN